MKKRIYKTTCTYCGLPFVANCPQTQFCSHICMFYSLLGDHPPNSCWVWPRVGATFQYKGKNYNFRRLAWELQNGPLPAGYAVSDICRTSSCCNPKHLVICKIGRYDNFKPKPCKYCGVLFSPQSQSVKFCSLKCSLFSHITITGNNDCWQWTGKKHRFGHGKFFYNGKEHIAQRASWEIHHGPIQDNLCVLHKCDNPECTNPSHLFFGTKADNCRDRTKKGRTAWGERQHNAKLTSDEVLVIRQLLKQNQPTKVLAERFGVTRYTIWDIKKGRSWHHLNDPGEGYDTRPPT